METQVLADGTEGGLLSPIAVIVKTLLFGGQLITAEIGVATVVGAQIIAGMALVSRKDISQGSHP